MAPAKADMVTDIVPDKNTQMRQQVGDAEDGIVLILAHTDGDGGAILCSLSYPRIPENSIPRIMRISISVIVRFSNAGHSFLSDISLLLLR